MDIHLSAGRSTRESIPEKDLERAQIWARGRIEAESADFGAIYFPAGGGVAPGTGALECSYDRAVGWYRQPDFPFPGSIRRAACQRMLPR